MSLIAAIAFVLMIAPQGAQERSRPTGLLAMESNRSKIASGEIGWTLTYADDPENPRRFVQRMARNGDTIVEERGDREGRTRPTEAPGHRGGSTFPQIMMRNGDGWWYQQETSPSARWYDEYSASEGMLRTMLDVRGLGVAPSTASLTPDLRFASVWNDPDHKIVKWDEWREGDKVVVSGECSTGGLFTWRLDPKRGWNAERISFEFEGHVTQEVRCTLGQFDGIWLPARCEYFVQGELTRTFEIQTAQLNRSDDPRNFTPGDMGMEPGTNIHHIGHPNHGSDDLPVWNGEAVSTWGKFVRDVQAGRRQWGPTFQRVQATGHYDSPYLTDEQRAANLAQGKADSAQREIRRYSGLWVDFVRDFCRQNELDREQTGKANQILADCQKRAGEFVSRHEADLTECANRLIAARKEDKKDEIDRAQKRLDNLAAPIQDIFRKTLKPRLEGLLTAEQRERARGMRRNRRRRARQALAIGDQKPQTMVVKSRTAQRSNAARTSSTTGKSPAASSAATDRAPVL